jgi:hypothetical protein
MPGHKEAYEPSEIVMTMRSASKGWPTRLLATAVALALAVVYVIGAYAHAMAHPLPRSGDAAASIHASHHASPPGAGHAPAVSTTAPDHGRLPAAPIGDDRDGTEHSLDCCDMMCHGGIAILATALVVSHRLLGAPAMEPAAVLLGAAAPGLDRPPKPFQPA